jgi:hypothetical protein
MPATTGATMPDVSLFATGIYRDQPWTLNDLCEIARNAKRLGPTGNKLIIPPAVLGHDEDQRELEKLTENDRTDMPAAAWINTDSVRVVPYYDQQTGKWEGILKGTLEDVHPEVAQKIDAKQYRFGSAEIYDDFKDDHGNSYGKALRRFSLLGGEVPQVKRLGELPKPQYFAEIAVRKRIVTVGASKTSRGTTVLTFGELTRNADDWRDADMLTPSPISDPATQPNQVEQQPSFGQPEQQTDQPIQPGPMPEKAQLIATLQQAMPGIAQTTLDALNPEQLADLVKNVPTMQPLNPALAPQTPTGGSGDINPKDPVTIQDGVADASKNPQPGAKMADSTGSDPGAAPMAREELIHCLSRMGQDPASLQAMTDEDLQSLYKQTSMGQPAPTDTSMFDDMGGDMGGDTSTDPDMSGDMGADDYADDPTATETTNGTGRDDMVTGLAAQGQDPALMADMDDKSLAALNGKLNPIGKGAPAPIKQADPTKMGATCYTDRNGRKVVPAVQTPQRPKMSPQALQLHRMAEQATKRFKKMESDARELKMQRINAFAEELIKPDSKGRSRLLPAHKSLVITALAGLDDLNKVHKHSENGRTSVLTAIDLKMAEMRKYPAVLRFGEKYQGKDAPRNTSESALLKIRAYAEAEWETIKKSPSNRKFKSPEDYVKFWEESGKKTPSTVQSFAEQLPPQYAV